MRDIALFLFFCASILMHLSIWTQTCPLNEKFFGSALCTGISGLILLLIRFFWLMDNQKI